MALCAHTATAGPHESLDAAAEQVVASLVKRLLASRPAGQIRWVEGSHQAIVQFADDGATVDDEYLVRRTPTDAHAFGQPVAVVRIAEIQGDMARVAVIWRDRPLQVGDRVTAPERITVLLGSDGQSGNTGRTARTADLPGKLEQALLPEGRLRVIRADPAMQAEWRTDGLARDGDYAVIVSPALLGDAGGDELVLNLRSLFTGQTLAAFRARLPARQAPPAAARSPVAAVPVTPPIAATPYGGAIRPVEPPDVRAVARPRDHVSVEFAETIKAVATGDVDADGTLELVGITDTAVIVYDWTGRDLQPAITGPPLGDFTTFLHVDAGDINGNGRDEIVLTMIRTVPRGSELENTTQSRIVEVSDGRLVAVSRAVDEFARVLHRPGQKPLLLTQPMGTYEPFAGAMTIHHWQDQAYRRQGRAALPAAVSSLYGFVPFDLDGDGNDEIALVSEDRHLRVLDPGGRPLWESDDDLGEINSRGFAQIPRHPDYAAVSRADLFAELLAEWRLIPRRVVVTAGPSAPEIVTLRNPRTAGFRIASLDVPRNTRGHAVGYGWDAETGRFAKRWETAALSGATLDVAVGDLTNDGRQDLIILSGIGDKRMLDIMTLYDR